MSSSSSAPDAGPGALSRAPRPVAPTALFLLQLGLVLTLHGGLRSELLDITALAPSSYREPSLVTGMLESTRLMIPLLLGALAGLLLRQELAWKTLDQSQATRWLVTAVALVLAVTVATLDYNAWYGRVWPFDRLALVALAGLLAVHPGFSFPLLALLLVFLGQIAEPLPGANWHWPDKRLPIDFLILFVAFLCSRVLTRARLPVLVAAALILVGGAYSHAAVSKLEIGPKLWVWPLENSTSNILVSAYLNGGWLRPLGDQRVVSLAGFLARLDPIVGVLTVIAELGGFLILVSPRLTRLLLAAWVSLHTVILLTTGIFFWKWILFDIACALWLTRLARAPETQPAIARAFARTTAIFGVLAIAITPRLYRNVDFAWFDTRLAGWFELTGVAGSGQSYRIDPRYFAPYDITFQQSRFHYLRGSRTLVGTYGVAHSHAIFSSLEGATARDVPSIEARLGRRLGDPRAADRWTEFVRAWFRASAARGARHVVPRSLSPPFHFQSFAAPNTYDGQEPLQELRVEYLEVFHEPDRLVPLRRDRVMTIDLR
jgi:hypothetical protein